MKLTLLFILFVFNCSWVSGQTFKLKAGICNSDGKPQKDFFITTSSNTKKHRISNYKGLFSIKTEIGDTLILVDTDEMIYTVPVINQHNKKFILTENNTNLPADGQVLRKLETIEKNKYRDIVKSFQTANPQLYYNSVFDMIKAEYPDLEVDEGTGRITVRGLNSLSNQAYALVVVDGVKGMDYRGLNPSDIESITVIKDATAGIYGGRATGGVVEIQTKRSEK